MLKTTLNQNKQTNKPCTSEPQIHTKNEQHQSHHLSCEMVVGKAANEQSLQTEIIKPRTTAIHPVIFRHEHPSILREAFSAMYRYVNVCKCKLISRERIRQILNNNFIAVSLGKTTTCIWLNIGRKIEKYEQACTVFLVSIVFKRATWNFEKERNKSKF